ncbi:phospholipid carrier-dependent glycosyltransferase [Rhizocola hellebori]|uniref:Polyprenol-phosphate-mannose--protein mannosyltransferase n=2 Tax=Rhizocola hellebori TaxID=1392758 RepID=A0A8J3Q2C2_9ACTN|nr:phospholipid carrier-dependent glycosyltransferase [Rhizocola hellebori]
MTAPAWFAAFAVATIGAVIRIANLGSPNSEIFDEVHYVGDANDMLTRGVEWDVIGNGPAYVVHPPLGKWMIAAGIKAFGYDSFGWRIGAAVIGVATILMITRVAHRLFGSLVLGCAAGLLMAFDGMHFVLSRSALLDIFLMFFVLAAFGALVLDRDQRRERWARFVADGGDPGASGPASRPAFAVPWWRLASAALLGCATGVKWSALAFLPALLILVMWWEIGVRRRHGARRPVLDAFLDELLWLVVCFAIVVVVYLATWSGWFLTDTGYYRHWLRDRGLSEPFFFGDLRNLIEYHHAALQFHLQLDDAHPFASPAWTWLVLGRSLPFYIDRSVPCGATDCIAEIVLLGTPLLWWSFLPALLLTAWFGVARRDWRAGAILVMSAFALVPWFFFSTRTMFYFYALPAEPFLILAVVFTLGMLASSPRGMPQDFARLQTGTVIAGAFVILVVLNFAFFFPIYSGESIPTLDWAKRMWLGNRWA